MLAVLTQHIFGSANSRYLKGLDNIVVAVNAAEPALEALTDDELRARTDWLRGRCSEGESLDDLLVDRPRRRILRRPR